jgi:N-hydroxyarylamine O-acetyltransferase
VDHSELQRYFARIAYDGPREPTLSVLHALTAAHAQHIPFENLDVQLGRGVALSSAAVFDKLVERRRGGYCFEQNGLFLEVLSALGFNVTPLSARVRLNRPQDVVPARTHLCLKVLIDDAAWLTDVGVGAASLTAAIRLEPNLAQGTPHEARRTVRDGDRWFHQIRYGEQWTDVYEFTGESMPPIDREVANWFTSTHPDSFFKKSLMVARAGEDGRRYTLSDREFTTRERDGRANVRVLGSQSALLEVLAEQFDLHFEPGTRFPVANLAD